MVDGMESGTALPEDGALHLGKLISGGGDGMC